MPLNLPRDGTRERQVLDLLCTGSSNKEIARELGISSRTVEIHRMKALRRLGAKNGTHAVSIVLNDRIEQLKQQLGQGGEGGLN